MLLTIVAIWAIGIPLAVLAISWVAANRREARAAQAMSRLATTRRATRRPSALPACAVRAARPRRTITRRVCPKLVPGAGRRPASA